MLINDKRCELKTGANQTLPSSEPSYLRSRIVNLFDGKLLRLELCAPLHTVVLGSVHCQGQLQDIAVSVSGLRSRLPADVVLVLTL